MSADELNKMAIQIKFLEEQIERLQTQIQLVENSMINLENAKITIENTKLIEEDLEILIPIGNISFLKGKITDTKNIIINLGSEVYAEVTVDIAKENIEKRIEDLKKTQEAIGNRLQTYVNQMNEIRPKFQELYGKLQERSASSPPSA